MKLVVILLLITLSAWAKPIVLISYFDAFNNAPFNNSENVSQALTAKFQNNPEIELKVCKLKTVFDKSFFDLQSCMNELAEFPKLVIGLGESSCKLKVETMARNLDHSQGPDNEGIERKNSPIELYGPTEIGLNYPLASMYCSLNESEQKILDISNNAGSFVCNNVAYQFSYIFEEIPFGFIHVPAHTCRDLDMKTKQSVEILSKMILKALLSPDDERLKTRKVDLQTLRRNSSSDKCRSDFYRRTKGIDEKDLWPFSWLR
jgi:pyrrolidone-carboxylate peptidase